MSKVSIFTANDSWKRGKLIQETVTGPEEVGSVINSYCDKLFQGFTERGYLGFMKTIDTAKKRDKTIIKYTWYQACVLFKNKNFIIEVTSV